MSVPAQVPAVRRGARESKPGSGLLAGATAAVIGLLAVLAAAVVAALAAATTTPSGAGSPVGDIPADYLAAYHAASRRFELGLDGWSFLAAIGKVETDHGRLKRPGVLDGQNTHGCCAGPMQIHNGYGAGTTTWGAFRTDGDGDGRENIYDPEDAIATGARYLRASGAPGDWRRAVFAYNHADWYVDKVFAQAAAYRRLAATAVPEAVAGTGPQVPLTGRWLAPLPDFPGERCDARIVADVTALVRAFGIHVSDCFGGAPHKIAGEHPLGLAIDASPADGDWDRTLRLARAFGWEPSCAATGCAGRGPFRTILYNGFPGHGDPAHTDNPHIHLSWLHAPAQPFTPARWVRVLPLRTP